MAFVALVIVGALLPPSSAQQATQTARARITPHATDAPTPTVAAPTQTDMPGSVVTIDPMILATQAFFTKQQTQAAAGQVVQVASVPTTAATQAVKAAYDQAQYTQTIADSLSIVAGGRHIQMVRVYDGRSDGGLRGVIVSYLTTESNEVGYVDEWIDLYGAIAAAIDNQHLDLDSITLIAGSATGQTVGNLVVSVSDLMAYENGQINRQTFLGRISKETY